MKKKNLKGFTLVELIVVMAIFSILMVAVLSIIDPASKLMKRASLQETNSAVVSNMKSYFESTLRYADAIITHEGDLSEENPSSPGTWVPVSGATEKDKMEKAVVDFLKTYYNDRAKPSDDDTKAAPFEGVVRMLKVDNDNGGHLSEYQWNFKAGYSYLEKDATLPSTDPDYNKFTVYKEVDPILSSYTETLNVINPVYYRNYSFYVSAGYNEMQTINGVTNASTSAVTTLPDPGSTSYYGTIRPIRDASGNTYTAYDPINNPNGEKFSQDMFSLSIVTYRNGTGRYDFDLDGVITDDPATVENESEIFVAPFAISNATMSLLNITSNYARATYYGPVRRSGKMDLDNPLSKTYQPTDMWDQFDNETNGPGTDGKWDYEEKTPPVTWCYQHPKVDGNNLYFIYTLPNAK